MAESFVNPNSRQHLVPLGIKPLRANVPATLAGPKPGSKPTFQLIAPGSRFGFDGTEAARGPTPQPQRPCPELHPAMVTPAEVEPRPASHLQNSTSQPHKPCPKPHPKPATVTSTEVETQRASCHRNSAPNHNLAIQSLSLGTPNDRSRSRSSQPPALAWHTVQSSGVQVSHLQPVKSLAPQACSGARSDLTPAMAKATGHSPPSHPVHVLSDPLASDSDLDASGVNQVEVTMRARMRTTHCMTAGTSVIPPVTMVQTCNRTTFNSVHAITLVSSLLTTSFHSAAGFDISDGEKNGRPSFSSRKPHDITLMLYKRSVFIPS